MVASPRPEKRNRVLERHPAVRRAAIDVGLSNAVRSIMDVAGGERCNRGGEDAELEVVGNVVCYLAARMGIRLYMTMKSRRALKDVSLTSGDQTPTPQDIQ